jgi:hypothetical protein
MSHKNGDIIVPPVALLSSPLLGSPLHGEGQHVLVMRGSNDYHCWSLNERWMEAETHQSQHNSLVVAGFPIVG